MPDHLPPARRYQQGRKRQQQPGAQGGITHAVGHCLELEGHRGMTAVGYHGSRLVADDRRDVLWQSLWRYCFSAMVGPMIVCWIWVPAIAISSTLSWLAAASRSIRGRASRLTWPL